MISCLFHYEISKQVRAIILIEVRSTRAIIQNKVIPESQLKSNNNSRHRLFLFYVLEKFRLKAIARVDLALWLQ